MNKCSYLGCNRKALENDYVEIAPGEFKKVCVCKNHIGQLTEKIAVSGKKISKALKAYEA